MAMPKAGLGLTPEPPPADHDPCPRRTREGLLCVRARYHRGKCAADAALAEAYQDYAAHVRRRAVTMTRREMRHAAEFHLVAWRVLQGELNAR